MGILVSKNKFKLFIKHLYNLSATRKSDIQKIFSGKIFNNLSFITALA